MEATLQPRLIVVLFQTDINLYKIKGVVRMAPQAAQFVRSLSPADRVAFLTFESHLQLRADFTVEHEALAKMITTTEILDASIEAPEPSTPRLSDHFNADRAYKAATMTEALEGLASKVAEADEVWLASYGDYDEFRAAVKKSQSATKVRNIATVMRWMIENAKEWCDGEESEV